MTILTKKIIEKYQNLHNFCEEEGLSLGAVNALRRAKGNYFKTGSKAFKAYKKMKKAGYIEENQTKETAQCKS